MVSFNYRLYRVSYFSHKALTEEELIKEIKDVHILGIRSKTQITQKVLDAAHKLQAIGCFCIGVNQVNLEAATHHGVVVFNAPYSNTRSVAELVIGLSIMLIRRIPDKNKAAHEGIWMKDAKGSFELRGKTLGIIGYGNIGSQVSVLAEALGMKVIFYDVETKLPLGNATDGKTLKDVLGKADVVTLHVPETTQTKNIINKTTLKYFKKGSILINYARGEVVDLEAAGINVIQIDEPAIREGLPLRRADWQAYLDWAVDCFRLATAGVRDETQIHTHMCYSEFNDIIESIAAMDADVITIETSRSNMELLKAFEDFRYPNDIGPGVYDIHSPNVPEVDWMVGLMQKAAARLPRERLWVNPDCGLKTRAWPETEAALIGMVQAARALREAVCNAAAGRAAARMPPGGRAAVAGPAHLPLCRAPCAARGGFFVRAGTKACGTGP